MHAAIIIVELRILHLIIQKAYIYRAIIYTVVHVRDDAHVTIDMPRRSMQPDS